MKDAGVGNWLLLAMISAVGIALSQALAAQPMIVSMSLVNPTGLSFSFVGMISIAF
ncbi:hypothetical protein LZG74_11205 [Dyadobacter sp. CY327]|uniref:hypothetical protein n=1 Tax=Dyadobacter sp. CY327 TaxID=2907301 RepID=UPI001F2A56B8|nr:hypothetical protein [Dyadobacter sp. CY327]MCE7070874.1 hypothetical protein [Dyadobacter sp. CY327]